MGIYTLIYLNLYPKSPAVREERFTKVSQNNIGINQRGVFL